MAETTTRIPSLEDVRTSVKRMQAEGERLVGVLRRDARALTTREGRAKVLQDVRKLTNVTQLQTDLRKRAEDALQGLQSRQGEVTRQIDALRSRVESLVRSRLRLAGTEEVAELRARLATLEERLETLSKSNKAA